MSAAKFLMFDISGVRRIFRISSVSSELWMPHKRVCDTNKHGRHKKTLKFCHPHDKHMHNILTVKHGGGSLF